MGKELLTAVLGDDRVKLSSASCRVDSPMEGIDAASLVHLPHCGVKITSQLAAFTHACDAVIDFTSPGYTLQLAEHLAHQKGKIHIIGTTGMSVFDKGQLEQYSNRVTMVCAPNMSLGVNLLMAMAEKIAAALDDSYDAEILEMHHRRKVDAPSGTALGLGEAVARGRGVSLAEKKQAVRDGIMYGKGEERPRGEIGFATLRGGDVIGDHTVIFAGPGERVELGHKASNRSIYANGAIRAALWAAKKQPGFYSMRDVLGI
jgi:4-hydroxy-tetrahydrodipicolinate reductase